MGARGFPDSSLASSERTSQRWRQDFIRTYLERDIPMFGSRIAAVTQRRFWAMLAHHQSGLLNAADFARSLGVDNKTVANYLDLLVDLLLVRRLEPWHNNAGKRLVKTPRISVRDSGWSELGRLRHRNADRGCSGGHASQFLPRGQAPRSISF